MDTFDDFISDLQRIHDGLEDPRAFFAAHEAGYLEMARRVGVQTLLAMRPQEVAADVWRENVENFAELVFSRSIAGGLEILYAGRTESQREGAAGKASYTPITYADVLEWVRAGPENGGKDLTAIENSRGRNPEQIAYDVHNAIVQHRLGIEKKDYGRITERLEEWVNSRVLAGDMGELLAAVLEAWFTVLAPVVGRDFEQWVEKVMKG
jgi:hypothetical protein